jgi:hypothetical protein
MNVRKGQQSRSRPTNSATASYSRAGNRKVSPSSSSWISSTAWAHQIAQADQESVGFIAVIMTAFTP